MRASSFLGGICFLAKTLYHKGVGVLNFHLSLQNAYNLWEGRNEKIIMLNLINVPYFVVLQED
jgi:hypothetical protein